MTMKKFLALFLSLVLLLIPLSSVVTSADVPAEGYALDAESKTYTVYTPEGYNAVAALINDGKLDYNITLANDLTFTKEGDAANFTTIGKAAAYTGTFDGAYHMLRGLQTDSDTLNGSGKADANNRYRALIGQAGEGCTVKDLAIFDSAFYGSEYVSAVIGNATDGDITVSNVHIRNTVIAGDTTSGKSVGNNVAGFCGRFNSSTAGDALFENCTVDATIRSFKNAVGICGGDNASAVNITIRNCVVAGEIETTLTAAGTGASAGFLGWTNGLELTIENSVCLATLKSAFNGCGFVNSLARNGVINMTNTFGIGPVFGEYSAKATNMTCSFTNCKVLNLTATTGTAVALWNTTPASVPGTLTIDGEGQDFLTATLPSISVGTLKTRVATMYAADPTFLTVANELVDATLVKLSGIALQGLQETAPVADALSVRFLGTIAASYTQFNALGFDVAYIAPDSTVYAAQEVAVKTVYTSILASEGGEMVAHNASDFNGAAYIFALTLEDVPATGTCVFTVTPFICSGETKLTGTAYEITYTNGAFVSSTPVVGRD